MKLKQGFTVIEILVVIGIIAILTVIILPSISNLRAKNRDTERVADIAAIQLALSLYKNQDPNGSYPNSLEDLVSRNYTPSDSIVDPSGNEYLYVPLTRGTDSNAKCTYYHLGTKLEFPGGQIDTTNTFSTKRVNNQPVNANGYLYCNYSGDGIDGNYDPKDNIMYSVHP